mgnify:FL=1
MYIYPHIDNVPWNIGVDHIIFQVLAQQTQWNFASGFNGDDNFVVWTIIYLRFQHNKHNGSSNSEVNFLVSFIHNAAALNPKTFTFVQSVGTTTKESTSTFEYFTTIFKEDCCTCPFLMPIFGTFHLLSHKLHWSTTILVHPKRPRVKVPKSLSLSRSLMDQYQI